MKKLLIICTDFPPMRKIAANRMTSIVKYLVKKGWDINVITLGDRHSEDVELEDMPIIRIRPPFFDIFYSGFYEKQDNGNSGNLRSTGLKNFLGTKLVKNILRKLFFSILQASFIRKAFKSAQTILDKDKSKVIVFTTVPDISSLEVGYKLKVKYGSRVTLVNEYRDILSGNKLNSHSWLESKWLFLKERRLIDKIDFSISLTRIIKEHYHRLFKLNNNRVITNGYTESYSRAQDNGTFVFAYTGVLYGSRSPRNFLEALGKTLSKPEFSKQKESIAVNLAGKFPDEVIREISSISSKYEMDKNIRIRGVVSYQESLKIQAEADVNLLITHTTGSEYAIPGKLFEYIGSKRPILAISQDPLVKEIIEENDYGWVVPNSFDELEKIIQDILRQTKLIKSSKLENVEKFSRDRKNEEINEILKIL